MKTTTDDFLGGKIKVIQPEKGYRAGIDAVLLASSISAKSKQSILDVGCGVGTASLCLNERINDLHIDGFDFQDELIELAKQNSSKNNNIKFFLGNLEISKNIKKNYYDHVMTNPPYFKKESSTLSSNIIKYNANFETMNLKNWIQLCMKFVKPKGSLTVIHSAERLDEILLSIDIKKRSIKIIPIWPKVNSSAKRIIVQITKDKSMPLQITQGLIMHDEENYTKDAENILRHGHCLKH